MASLPDRRYVASGEWRSNGEASSARVRSSGEFGGIELVRAVRFLTSDGMSLLL